MSLANEQRVRNRQPLGGLIGLGTSPSRRMRSRRPPTAAWRTSGAAEIKAWQRSANVQIVPIKLCPLAKKQVAAILGKSQKMNLLQRAVMGDSLIMASLSRTSYRPGEVVAVQRKGGQLVVYVY